MSKLQEVAKLAGVSKATVSRVINNRSPVSDAAKKKVLDAMRELNFHAQQLKRSNEGTMIAGLIMPLMNELNPSIFVSEIMVGAEQKAFEQDYMLLIGNSNTIEKEHSLATKMVNRDVEGLIILSTTGQQAAEHFSFLENAGVPIVLVDQKVEGFAANVVRGDHFLGSINLMNHLFSLGHRNIALLSPPLNLSTYNDRIRGYRVACMEQGIHVSDQTIIKEERDQPLQRAVEMLLNAKSRPTALFVTHPLMLMDVVKIIEKHNLHIPNDISIVTFDDIYCQLPDQYTNFFTSITQSGQLIGNMAMELLFQKIKNPGSENQEIILPGTLNIRKSTGQAPS